MLLIKENKQKKRQTWKLDDSYKKIWLFNDLNWLETHVSIVNKVFPNYIREYGSNNDSMWLILNIIPGVLANQFEHTPEFIEKIYNFCLFNIQSTAPYVHGDWVLSNMIVNNDKITMCDWDNVNIYPKKEILNKLHHDLKSAFGSKFKPNRDKL
jgi:RIO-like serine/threonine protein kinase